MHRRTFLSSSLLTTGLAAAGVGSLCRGISSVGSYLGSTPDFQQLGPVRGFDPVIGDGRWIWREPPKDERGYLEPRSFEAEIAIEVLGVEDQSSVMASTPVPVDYPEQTIDEVGIETDGCQAAFRELAPGASQLFLQAPNVEAGQQVKATARFQLTLYKQYQGYEQEQFPAKQRVSNEIRAIGMGESPGIQANAAEVKKLATEIGRGHDHPWMKAQAYVKWIRESIRPQIGVYTSVLTAIRKKTGDCEEMSALFVAFCRATGIPARLVWVPNHNWAEFYLTDHEQVGHWIPVHPACYHWFGWTGAHELVIQKGDRVSIPEQIQPSRLLMDWMRSTGRVQTTYTAKLTPKALVEDGDAGPGMRSKDRTGEWKLIGKHEFDRYARR